MQAEFKVKDLVDIFDIKETKQTIINNSEKGLLPKSKRIQAGTISHRVWSIDQLPEIGKKYSFLKQPTIAPKILSTFVQKGGCLKSNFTMNTARMLALSGIKVLALGLDSQMSLNALLDPNQEQIEDISQIREQVGLYQYFYEEASVEDIIKSTDIPTLKYIPENVELALLEKKLRTEARRKEYFFKDKLQEIFNQFQVVIMDHSPFWNSLTEAGLMASTALIIPVETAVGGYSVIDLNLENIREFQQAMDWTPEEIFLVPTLKEPNKISQQILGSYMQNYPELVVPFSVRRAVLGQELAILRKSAMEYDPTSNLAQDYKDVVGYIWNKLLANEKGH